MPRDPNPQPDTSKGWKCTKCKQMNPWHTRSCLNPNCPNKP